MARSVRCPRCSTVVTVEEGQTPVCPACGFGGPVPGAVPSTAGPSPFSAPAPNPGASSPFSPVTDGMGGRPQQTSGTAVASLVLGIVTICIWWIPFVGFFAAIISGILAIILGAVGIKQVNDHPQQFTGKGLAVAGLVLGIIGLAFAILIISVLAAFLTSLRNG